MSTPEELYRNCLPGITAGQVQQLLQYAALLREWNRRVNIISRKDIESVEEHHILHAIAIARCVQFAAGARVIDIGTGGGLPGIPLAIIFPDAHFTLVDSIAKKIRAVSDMTGRLGLSNSRTWCGRAECISGAFDYVIGRAVASLPQVIRWTAPKLSAGQRATVRNGLLYLKGSRYDEECRALNLVPEHVWPLHAVVPRPFFEEKYLIHLPAEGLTPSPKSD